MIISLNLRPVKVRTLREFTAADPWSDRNAARWSISLFRFVMEDYAVGAAWKEMDPTRPRAADDDPGLDGRTLRRDEVIGLETRDDRPRLLPRMLTRRWLEGEVRDEVLPSLLHRLEPRLRRVDFKPPPPTLVFAILAAIPGLILLGLAVALLWPTPAAHRSLTVSTAQWLAAPLEPATVMFEGGRLKLADRTLVPPDLKLPADLVGPAPDEVGFIKAARESRAVLYPGKYVYNGALEIWGGTVLPVDDVPGLGSYARGALRQQAPDLNTTFVLIADAGHERSVLDLRDEPAMAAIIAGIMLPLLAFVTVLWLRPRLRERRLFALIASQL
jgi:hypothetical protein